MTFQEYHLVCPYCGAFSKYHSMMSCTFPFGSRGCEREFTCTDLHSTNAHFSSKKGSKEINIPITCCHACHRYFQKEIAERFPSYESPASGSLPDVKVQFIAQEIHDAIAAGAYRGPLEEQELRSIAWVLANHLERESVTSKIVNEYQFLPVTDGFPADLPDRVRAFRSLISWWIDGSEMYELDHLLGESRLPKNENDLLIATSPDFEIKIAEQIQVRQRASENVWKKRASEHSAGIEWKNRNLERMIELLNDSPIDVHQPVSAEKITNEHRLRIKSHLMKAEALRQLGRFDESLRLLGNPIDRKGVFLWYRHVAKVIQELASRGYSFLWLSIGEEDYTPAELVEIIRKKILDNQEAQRQQEWRQAARERDLAFVRKAIQFQELIDFRGSLNGKTTSQRIEEKLICPNCQFRYLWDGSRCGHCDKSVFEMGRPDDRTISKIRFELTGR